jgi:chemotaxis protein MotB
MKRWMLVVALLAVGCVKKSTHEKAVKALQAQIADRDRQLADKDKDLAERDGQIKDLSDEATTAAGEKAASDAELAELRELRENDQKRLGAFQDLQDRFKALVDAGDLEVVFRHGQMTLKLPSGVLFPSAGADLSDKGQKTLAKVVKILEAFKDKRFIVAGHTDDKPIKTDQFANNWYLSTARAIAVVQFMIDQGFPAKQLAAAGYADMDPVASNKSKKGRQKNRRIEIILVPDLSDLPKLTK